MTNYSHADVQVADAGFLDGRLYMVYFASPLLLLFVAQDTTKRRFKGSLRPLTPAGAFQDTQALLASLQGTFTGT